MPHAVNTEDDTQPSAPIDIPALIAIMRPYDRQRALALISLLHGPLREYSGDNYLNVAREFLELIASQPRSSRVIG